MTATAPRPPLKPLDQALVELLAQALPLEGTETVSTLDGDGRVLAQDLRAALQVPLLDNSAMDGYALRCADWVSPEQAFVVSQRIAAGQAGAPLQAGTVARIFTGAPLPAGADTIVPQEEATVLPDGKVRFAVQPCVGDWVRRGGEDIARGAVLLAAGTRLGPAELGLAASIGLDRLTVARRPRVALCSTGDELVMPGEIPPEQLPPGALYDSNRFFLRALLRRLGCEVTDLGQLPDERQATLQALQAASQDHDLVLTSGGVSVGEEDHVKPAVEALGRLDLWQIAMKPGKPFAYGRLGPGLHTHFIGLPGNPVSSFVTFVLLVRPFLLRLQGVQDVTPKTIASTARFHWPRPDKRREFLRVRQHPDGGLELFPNQSSGVLTSAAWADGLIDNPPGQAIAPGDPVRYLPLSALLT